MIRVLIADDHKVVRQGLRFLLSSEAGIAVAGEAADGVAALEAIRSLRPDVVLLDLLMPRLDGLGVLAAMRELRHAAADPLSQLTPRETDVLKGLAQGRSNREIAKALSVSEETVKSHVSSILAKLGLADRTQAAIYALQHHLVPLDQALGPHEP